MGTRRIALAILCVALPLTLWAIMREKSKKGDAVTIPIDASLIAAHPALAATDPAVLANAEAKGLSLASVLGGDAIAPTTETLYRDAPAYRDVVDVLARDLHELSARPKIGEGPNFGNHAFREKWLHDPRTRFELVGAIQRLDRRTGEPVRGCGEVRLVYRLAADPKERPTTRLPMTLNILFPEPSPQDGCAAIAKRWAALAARGEERVRELVAIFRERKFDQIEVNLQNVHGPSLHEDQDDHAEYVLRAFDADPKGAKPRGLFNTPRPDLDVSARAELIGFVRDHFAAIDDGTWVVPTEFLAQRVVSVTPRGLERPANRTWSSLLQDAHQELAALPYDRGKVVQSPSALVRRLEEGTCAGCHQTRAVAGFHLLGEDRVRAPLNTLATAGSQHWDEDLRWREAFLAAELTQRAAPPRPFTSRPLGAGGYGSACGLGDWGFASWTCAAGLQCRSLGAPDLGLCLPFSKGPGDACQVATVIPRPGADGDRVAPSALEPCSELDAATAAMQCSPNAYGFTGGLCSSACDTLGDERAAGSGSEQRAKIEDERAAGNGSEQRAKIEDERAAGSGSETICADIPSSGYESDCFFVPVPIEKCIETHKARRRVRSCDADRPCRPDFACVAVDVGDNRPGTIHGACVPPYFVFQARIDGPMLDRP